MSTLLNAVIVDDERLARQELIRLLDHYPEVNIIAEADSVDSASRVLNHQKFDVLFLDIELAGESGFDILEYIRDPVEVVFVTAYDEYAIRAFDVNAVDYLLKPVNPRRLRKTINRLLQETARNASEPSALCMDDSVVIKADQSFQFVKLKDMLYIQAEGDYTRVRLSENKEIWTSKTMKVWEVCLPQKHFSRIHRSTILNINYIARVEPWFNGAFHIYLSSLNEPLVLSRRYASRFKEQYQF